MIFEHFNYLCIVNLIGFLSNLIEIASFRLSDDGVGVLGKQISP